MTPTEFAKKISATNVPPKTSIIDIAVTDPSPARARQLAQTVAEQFSGYADALETPTGEDSQKVKTTVVSAASEPRSRLAERVALGVLVTLAALLTGAVAVWIRSLTDPVIRTAERAGAVAGVPVVGCVTLADAASPDDLGAYLRLWTHLRSKADPGTSPVSMLISAVGEVEPPWSRRTWRASWRRTTLIPGCSSRVSRTLPIKLPPRRKSNSELRPAPARTRVSPYPTPEALPPPS